ncbi:uncharacterized protein LOC133886910 [Phragmites australis]|uniref:uncharacterized protein LOC133886910 n=1 Tax=Phragmites australis TaxID=29695 RepID=UPI002D799BBB|nr:uncharacterized protein LOC133886910 [Phragmites australis]
MGAPAVRTTLTTTSRTLPGGDRFDIPEGDDKEEWIQFFDEATRATREVIARYGDGRPADGVNRASLLPNSSHRDGSIYTITSGWHKDYRISDRNETRLEPMNLSNPSNCYPNQETCLLHITRPMMQIFSMKLGQISVDGGPVQLYGYVATRDTRDRLRNYVFNRSRDDPITLELGSFIEMTGPKRGIGMRSAVLIEYDMRIKRGEQEADDLQLIDGVSDFSELTTPICKPFLSRIDGLGGAVDITLAMFHKAVEATIQVDISQVHGSGFSLLVSSFVSGLEKEIQLFHDVVSQSFGLRSFVVAVVLDTWMHLKFNFAAERGGLTNEVERCISFKAKKHGCASQQIKLDEASIMVKVSWSTW